MQAYLCKAFACFGCFNILKLNLRGTVLLNSLTDFVVLRENREPVFLLAILSVFSSGVVLLDLFRKPI